MTTITLRKAMKILDGEAWTVATDDGERWLYYFDGKDLHAGTHIPLDEFLERKCVEVYERDERKYWTESEKKNHPYMELEAGLAFIVEGDENGQI